MTVCTPWRVGNALNKLLAQFDAQWPGRSKASDGSIGDAAHQDEGACGSQHNSCCIKLSGIWIIRARDFTHDPASGADMGRVSEAMRLARDPRVRYIIFNRRITGPSYGWEWRAYSGSNPHDKHMHVSVWDDAARFDNTADWSFVARASVSTQEGDDMIVQVRNGDPNAGGIYAVSPGSVYHITAVDWAGFSPTPPFIKASWSFVAGMAAASVNVPPDTFTADEIALLAAAVAAQVVQDPGTPAQPADAAAIADAVATKLSERLAA